MTYAIKYYHYVFDYMKKEEGVKLVVQTNILSKESHNTRNISGSYSRGYCHQPIWITLFSILNKLL